MEKEKEGGRWAGGRKRVLKRKDRRQSRPRCLLSLGTAQPRGGLIVRGGK